MLMRSNELYKFSDGILTFIRTILHDIASNLRMDFLPKRRWSTLDRQRSRIMIKVIDKFLLQIRLMRSLEKFVGGRDYEEDFRQTDRAWKSSLMRMDFLPKRRWSTLNRQRSRIMIKVIDKFLLQIRLMRSLEKFVGGRDYEEDFRLLERTI
nr:hypothetical protein [Tanacetum cinerariifolium]